MKIIECVQNRWNNILYEIQNKERSWYRKKKLRQLRNRDFTILASNCCGTFMYYDLRLPYLTPTVNLTIDINDLIKMVSNLKWYMEQEIVEIKEENGEYPAGMCGDIRINFVHYDSFEEGVCKWEERKQRINWNNLFIVGTERDGCTYETLKRFEQLPYTNKVIFTHIEYPEFSSAYYIKGFEDQGEIGTVTNWRKQFLKRRYMDDFDYVSFLNGDC